MVAWDQESPIVIRFSSSAQERDPEGPAHAGAAVEARAPAGALTRDDVRVTGGLSWVCPPQPAWLTLRLVCLVGNPLGLSLFPEPRFQSLSPRCLQGDSKRG